MIKRRTIYKVGSTRIELINPDLDGDGETGGIEKVQMKGFDDMIPASQKSETAEASEILNSDKLEGDSRLSSMDFMSNIPRSEYDAMTKVDVLIAMKFLSSSASWINRVRMRKSKSIDGQGIDKFVQLHTGMREAEVSRMDRVKSFFSGKKEE